MLYNRKVFVIFPILLFIIIIMNSCINNSVIDKSLQQKKYIEMLKSEVVRCIEEKDKDGLNNLFCENIKDTNFLKSNIKDLFDFVGEKTVKFNNYDWHEMASHGSTDGYGWYSIDFKSYSLDDITINDRKYIFVINFYDIFNLHPEYIGLVSIGFTEDMGNELIKYIEYPDKKRNYFGIDLFTVNCSTNIYENVIDKDYNYLFTFDAEIDR